MIQDQFVIPLRNLKSTESITTTSAEDLELPNGGTLLHVDAIDGDAWISAEGDAAIDGSKSVVIPEGKDKTFSIHVGSTVSILGGGNVVVSSFG